MTSTISDFFSSAPNTPQLHAPLEVQRADDFASTITTASTETTFNSAGYEDVDWSRLLDYKEPTDLNKRYTSWVWAWGYRLLNKKNGATY
jgi:hypothetical protein